MTTQFYPSIGLEIHLQLGTRTKVFCDCPAEVGEEPNTNICPICIGLPGVLPALNEHALKSAYTIAHALSCTLAPSILFERKSYFYPDLPKNYQISQFGIPIGRNGRINFSMDGEERTIGIHEVHLEEDAGKMIHTSDLSLLDYNRAGTPLLEVVTTPELRSGKEAEALLLEMRRIIRYCKLGSGNMEEGALRCDANASVSTSKTHLNAKAEIKNVNSSRFVRLALDYEIERQKKVLLDGGTVIQETRTWDENRGRTDSMRRKEHSEDYRYLPEPDLPPYIITTQFMQEIESRRIELPNARIHRIAAQHQLKLSQVELLCEERDSANFFEQCIEFGADPLTVANMITGDVQKILNRTNSSLAESNLTPKHLATLVNMLTSGHIHGAIAKQILPELFEKDSKLPDEIVAARGLARIDNKDEIEKLVQEVFAQHKSIVDDILQNGNKKAIGFLMGEIMKRSQGRADPQLVRAQLDTLLQNPAHDTQDTAQPS